MSKKHFFCYLAVVAVLFTACKKDANVIHVTEIMLNYEELALIPGDTITLIATMQPDDATNKTITWTSSDTAVATVNNNGLVTAIANGEAIITTTTKYGNLTDSCFVTVDYRLQWIGDWDFVVKTYKWDWSGYGWEWWDTIYYLGTISLKDDYGLTIKYYSSINVLMINEDGEFVLNYYSDDVDFGKFVGDDKVYFCNNWRGSHGVTGGSHTVEGTKRK